MLKISRNLIRRPQKRAVAGAAVLYLWSLVSTNIAFYGKITITIFLARILYAMIAFVALEFVFEWLIPNIDTPSLRSALKMFLIYLAVNFIIFRCIYPGGWKWDDIVTFNGLMGSGHMSYWQHYMTSIFYILCLCLFPAGIVMIQIVIISAIFAYCFYVLEGCRIGGRAKYLLLLPFFLLPAFHHNMWPLRLSMYCMLELLLVVMVIEPKIRGIDIWRSPTRCIVIAFLTAVLSNWRTEGMLYVIMVPLCLILLYNRPFHWKRFVLLLASCIALTSLASIPQRHGMGQSKNYDLTGILMPVTPLCAEASRQHDEELLSSIDKVLNVQTLLDYYGAGKTGMAAYWDDQASIIRSGFTEKDYDEMRKSYIKLVIKYPRVYLKERFQTFLHSSGRTEPGNMRGLYTNENPIIQYFTTHYYVNRPIYNGLRDKVAEVLDGDGSTQWAFNLYAQTLATICLTFYLLIWHRKWLPLALMMEVRMVLTFLTAPESFFMYYYNLWLFGSIIICAFLAYICYKISSKLQAKRLGSNFSQSIRRKRSHA